MLSFFCKKDNTTDAVYFQNLEYNDQDYVLRKNPLHSFT
jgi:hypothetical protein